MPLSTYYNLPPEKQERIVDAAINAFADYGYQMTSIKMIADEAQIAKGSMYQYFESKKELFMYIFDLVVQKKIEFVSRFKQDLEEYTFFSLLEHLFMGAYEYARANPRLYKLYNNIINSKSQEIKTDIQRKIRVTGQRYYKALVKDGVARQELRSDVNLELVAFVVFRFLQDFGEYVIERIEQINEEAIRQEINQLISIMKEGLEKRE